MRQGRFSPKKFGLGGRRELDFPDVPPLPPKPARVKILTDRADAAWKLYDECGGASSDSAKFAFDILRRHKKEKA
jgi:hypothetical protein